MPTSWEQLYICNEPHAGAARDGISAAEDASDSWLCCALYITIKAAALVQNMSQGRAGPFIQAS